MEEVFADRTEAARLLALKLEAYRGKNAVILAVPRGGVSIGYILAKELDLPMDIILSKKIGHPANEEYAIGAVSLDGVTVDADARVPQSYIDKEVERLRKSLGERYRLFRGNKPPLELKGKIVILTDDGIATGHTLLATIKMIRQKKPARIIVAVPVLPNSTIRKFQDVVDDLVYLSAPVYFTGVGAFFENFEQVSDEEVIRMLT